MRWNPFVMYREHEQLQTTFDQAVKTIEALSRQLLAHQTLVARELHTLKYGRPTAHSTLGNPLTPEQEEIVKEFNDNKSLPEQIRRHFARGGKFENRIAEGLFGEAGSDHQTRAIDPAVYAADPEEPGTKVNITVQFDGQTRSVQEVFSARERSQFLEDQFKGLVAGADGVVVKPKE